MQPTRASITALVTAFSRAYHARQAGPKVFDDFLAPQLFTPEEWAGLSHNKALSLQVLDPAAWDRAHTDAERLEAAMRVPNSSVTLPRSRFTEDALAASGASQYVLLGAGLDTLAYREPTRRVFEVDHPATQADKQARLARIGPTPPGLSYVPVDFATDDLGAALVAAGFDPTTPACFAWLGVSYYLPPAAVTDTLAAVGRLAAPGSVLVFDYLEPAALDPATASPLMLRLKPILEHIGEPFISALAPAKLAETLAAYGFGLDESLTPARIQARYFEPVDPSYQAFTHIHFARATRS